MVEPCFQGNDYLLPGNDSRSSFDPARALLRAAAMVKGILTEKMRQTSSLWETLLRLLSTCRMPGDIAFTVISGNP